MWRIMWRNDYNEARSLQELIEMIQRAEKESARGLAVAIGIGNTTVNRILAGEQIRDFNVIEAISAYTGLSKAHVLALAGHIPPPPLTHRLIRDEKTGKALSVVVNEALRPMFDVIARLLIEGKGMRVISYRLNDLGFRNPRTHKPYTDITIRWILFNPYTWGHAAWNWNSQIGHWAYDETLPVPESVIIQRNAVPPVWTGETAEAIKAALHERQRSGTVQRNAGYFTRLMVCDACGRGLTSTGAGMEQMQYFCVGRYYAPNPCADAYFIRATYIRDWLTARLTDILESADGFSVLVGGENPTTTVQSELAALALNYAQQQAEIENMVQDMASTTSRPVRDALLKAMDAKGEILEALELRMATLRETLSEMETPTDNTTRLQTLDELRANGIDWLWAQPSEDVNRLLRRVFGTYRLVVRNGKIIGVKKGV